MKEGEEGCTPCCLYVWNGGPGFFICCAVVANTWFFSFVSSILGCSIMDELKISLQGEATNRLLVLNERDGLDIIQSKTRILAS